MTLTINYSASPPATLIQGITSATDFSATLAPVDASVPALSIMQSAQDVIIDISVSPYTAHGQQIAVVDSPIAPTHTFSDITPSIAVTNAAGLVLPAPLSPYNNIATVDVVTSIGTRRYSGSVSTTGKTITTSSILFETGSLGKHIYDTIKALWNGKTPGNATMDTFSSNNYNTASPVAVRNASLWSGSFGLEAVSIMRSDRSDGQFPCMLIGPRHFYCAAHVAPAIGTKLVWLDGTSTTKPALVADGGTVEYSGTLANDIYVGYLDTAITTITPFKLLPSNYAAYLPSSQSGSANGYLQLPAIMKASHNLANTFRDCVKVIGLGDWSSAGCILGMPPNAEMRAWNTTVGVPIVVGDSGSPIYFKINGEAVLETSPTHDGSGMNLAAKASQMETLGTSFGTALSIGRADLSGFKTY